MAVIGLDAGGTKILVGTIDEGGKILDSKKYPMNRETQKNMLASIFGALSDYWKSREGTLPAPEGIAIGTTGHIDYERGLIVSYNKAPDATEVPLRKMLEEEYGLPVRIDNDVHCAALGEYFYGEGGACKSMLYVNVGTGLASAVIEDGRLLRGSVNAAGESGYFDLNLDGDPEETGIVEFVAAGGGLIDQARQKLPLYPDSVLHRSLADGTLHAGTIFDAAQAGDPLALRIAERSVKYIGAWLGGLLGALNPEKVVFGGGLVKNRWFFERLSQAAKHYAYVPITWDGLTFFGPTKLNSDQVGLIGAAALFKL